ncbi:oxidoreductase, partial [Salmonella enterica subsp. enterica serovar 1,4,[5],12:i:-]
GVLDGEVEHRDFVLTAQERAANDCMMVCVSRSACPLLVLQA